MLSVMREQVEITIEVIRPAVQADGGDVVLHAVHEDTGIVEVRLTGACVGCPSSNNTLKSGIERIMRDRVDGVTEVIDVAVHDPADVAETCTNPAGHSA